jgi:hypothetical protein
VDTEQELQAEEDRLVTLYMKGKISDEMYDKKRLGLDGRMSGLATLRSELEERLKKHEEAKADREALTLLARSASLLTNSTMQQKRTVLEALRTKITVQEDGSLDIGGLINDGPLANPDAVVREMGR